MSEKKWAIIGGFRPPPPSVVLSSVVSSKTLYNLKHRCMYPEIRDWLSKRGFYEGYYISNPNSEENIRLVETTLPYNIFGQIYKHVSPSTMENIQDWVNCIQSYLKHETLGRARTPTATEVMAYILKKARISN